VLDLLTGFVAELRASGIPVSLTEHLDAAEALRHVPIEDREALKYTLGASLVKSSSHWRAYETTFEIYFSLRGPEYRIGDETAEGEEADADDDGRRAQRITIQFDKDATELVVTIDEVVGPLELDAVVAFLFQRARDGDTHRQRQPGEKTRALLETPAQRERQASTRHGGPRATTPAAARGLPFGGEHGTVNVTALAAAQQFGGCRIELVDQLDLQRGRRVVARGPLDSIEPQVVFDDRRGLGRDRTGLGHPGAEFDQRLAHFAGVEEIGRGNQPVASATNALEREPGGFGLLENLRHAGARQPHFGSQILAGVESAIRQLAEQRKTDRSKH